MTSSLAKAKVTYITNTAINEKSIKKKQRQKRKALQTNSRKLKKQENAISKQRLCSLATKLQKKVHIIKLANKKIHRPDLPVIIKIPKSPKIKRTSPRISAVG